MGKLKDKPSRSRRRAAAGLRAVILAGGKGVRLHPFTINFPKPLVPLGDTPVIEVLMRRLILSGITDITLTLGHLAELIKAYFQHRRQLVQQLKLRFIEEEEPTGTAGSLSLIPGLTNTFLVMNGDLLTDLDFHALVDFHRRQKALLTIATHTRSVKIDLGVLECDAAHRVTGYREKPEHRYQVSTGVYVYEPAVLEHIPKGKHLDFPDLVLRLIKRGERVCAYPADCLWLDIGRPDDYARAQELFAERRNAFEKV
jgi:NDP-mannose synthase